MQEFSTEDGPQPTPVFRAGSSTHGRSGGTKRSGQVSESAAGHTGNRTGTEGQAQRAAQGLDMQLRTILPITQTTCKSKHTSRAARAPEFYYPSKQDRRNFSYPEAEADPAQQTQVCRIPARGEGQLLQQFPLKASLHQGHSRNISTLSFYPPSVSRDSYHHQNPVLPSGQERVSAPKAVLNQIRNPAGCFPAASQSQMG